MWVLSVVYSLLNLITSLLKSSCMGFGQTILDFPQKNKHVSSVG